MDGVVPFGEGLGGYGLRGEVCRDEEEAWSGRHDGLMGLGEGGCMSIPM